MCYFTYQAQKNTISCDFNLILFLVESKLAAKMATIISDVAGRQCHHP